MDLTIETHAEHLVVRMGEARLDAAIAGSFKDVVRPHVAGPGPDIVLDLTAVEFLDSSGLGAVIALKKALPEGRKIRLHGLTPNVGRVFRLTRMDRVFEITDDDAAGSL